MAERLDRETLALRVAREFHDGDVVNLGIGMPTLAASYIPEGRTVLFHAENGTLGYGPFAPEGEEDILLVNAGGQFITPLPGMSLMDSVEAFAMVRGGYVDITVLGAMQVSEKGDLANWMRPGGIIGAIGGAMDIATGARRVIAAMEHVDRQGNPKILKECTLPLTGDEVRRHHRDRYGRDTSDGAGTGADRVRTGIHLRGDTGRYRGRFDGRPGAERDGAVEVLALR